MNGFSSGRDERTEHIEGVAFRWAYIFLTFGILADATYRGSMLHQVTWDLLGLVMAGSLIVLLCQYAMGVMTKGIVKVAAIAGLIAVVTSIIVALAMKR